MDGGTGVLQDFLTATIAFIATNLDDFAVLMLLFLQAPKLWRETVAGQYLGFGVLVLLSLPGFWLGQLPLKPWIGLLGLLPIALGIRTWLNREEKEEEDLIPNPDSSRFAKILSPQIALVASLTIANGGDNIAIYTALFSGMKPGSLSLTLLVWSLWILLWCAIARYFSRRRKVQTLVSKYQHILVPIVLISLGIYVIASALI
jgi:cadmium resistance protein CadD (predicted permease)